MEKTVRMSFVFIKYWTILTLVRTVFRSMELGYGFNPPPHPWNCMDCCKNWNHFLVIFNHRQQLLSTKKDILQKHTFFYRKLFIALMGSIGIELKWLLISNSQGHWVDSWLKRLFRLVFLDVSKKDMSFLTTS